MRRGFTLIELLVVIALIAVVGTGVAAYYGREVVDAAKRQMTLHEMGQIRDAFQRFWSDNLGRISKGAFLPGTDTWLPTDRFVGTFTSGDAPSAGTEGNFERHYAAMELFERFGLWPLFADSAHCKGHMRDNSYFIVFERPNPVTGEGWRGPYISTSDRIDCVDGADLVLEPAGNDSGIRFLQPSTRFNDGNGGFYRVIYFEHCEDEGRAGETIYRRLILAAAERPERFRTWDDIKIFTGNRRGGTDSSPLDLGTGGIATHIEGKGLFFMELLNMDTYVR